MFGTRAVDSKRQLGIDGEIRTGRSAHPTDGWLRTGGYGPSTVMAITTGDVTSLPLMSSMVSILSGRLGVMAK